MKNFFRLLIVIGLITAGWLNRDKLSGLRSRATTLDESEPAAVTPNAPASTSVTEPTPHPATAARAVAVQAYPALKIPDSTFNKRFRSLYEEAQSRDPQLLADPNWPLKIAERTAVSLGGGAMPVATPPAPVKPTGLQGSALDKKPAH